MTRYEADFLVARVTEQVTFYTAALKPHGRRTASSRSFELGGLKALEALQEAATELLVKQTSEQSERV